MLYCLLILETNRNQLDVKNALLHGYLKDTLQPIVSNCVSKWGNLLPKVKNALILKTWFKLCIIECQKATYCFPVRCWGWVSLRGYYGFYMMLTFILILPQFYFVKTLPYILLQSYSACVKNTYRIGLSFCLRKGANGNVTYKVYPCYTTTSRYLHQSSLRTCFYHFNSKLSLHNCSHFRLKEVVEK